MASIFLPPCRLSVLLAREAPLALIFRRGPSKWTQLIAWNTQIDTLQSGAWFHGRIYPERGDLSPDGTKLIYFATNYVSHSASTTEFPIAWTAVSKTPWLTALGLWPHGSTYFGGGLFETNSKVWVNPDYNGWQKGERLAGHEQPRDLEVSYDYRFWNHTEQEFFRLQRDGWRALEPYPAGSAPLYRLQPDGGYIIEATDPTCALLPYLRAVYEKPRPHSVPSDAPSLVMTSTYFYSGGAQGKDSRIFSLSYKTGRRKSGDVSVLLEGAVWADWDRRGRLLYAKDGKLFAAEIRDDGGITPKEIADFNATRPRRTKSPVWDRTW